MSRHQPVSPFERSVFHRQGSAGALRFNAMPSVANVQAIAPVANVQPFSPASALTDPALPREVPAFVVYNPTLILDGKTRRAPRGIEAPVGVLLLLSAEGSTERVSVSVLRDRMNGVYALPAVWHSIYGVLLPGASVDDANWVRTQVRFVY